MDSHEEVRLSLAGPGEIKRREVSWTLTKKLDFHLRVQARSRGWRWCWTLKLDQKRSRAGRWSWAQKVRLLLQLLLSSSTTDTVLVTLLRTAVETAIAWYTSCYAMARGHRLINILVVWRRSTASSVFRVGECGRASLFRPLPPMSPSLISHLASVDVKLIVYYLLRPVSEPVWLSGKALGW